jgi:hypothetical protein
LLLYVTAGKRHIRKRELAISTGLITESDAGVVTYAGRAHTFLVTECALVVVEVSMALGDFRKSEKMNQSGARNTDTYQ